VTASQESTIRTCEALANGDEIEAWHEGMLLHRGRVSQTLPSMEMFWIVCARTGARKLVESGSLRNYQGRLPLETGSGEAANDVRMVISKLLPTQGAISHFPAGVSLSPPR
jgi:hypothetical protein